MIYFLTPKRFLVIHRIGGLETPSQATLYYIGVIHRIGGLENYKMVVLPVVLVIHRIGGLEN